MGFEADIAKLLDMISSDAVLQAREFRCCVERPGEIAVKHRRHLRGIWRAAGVGFDWIPAGHAAAAFRAGSLEDALTYTRDHVAKV